MSDLHLSSLRVEDNGMDRNRQVGADVSTGHIETVVAAFS